MPFEQLTPRPFTPEAIHTYAPVTPGVYGISNAREWIFIGEADNIQGALLDHLQDRSASLMKRQPAGFVFEVCGGWKRSDRQGRLVLEYGPVCNRTIHGKSP
jgi:hypothetical protein